eukprot:scaffold74774_cov66-Phaeocystis_antarctica.AAC.1
MDPAPPAMSFLLIFIVVPRRTWFPNAGVGVNEEGRRGGEGGRRSAGGRRRTSLLSSLNSIAPLPSGSKLSKTLSIASLVTCRPSWRIARLNSFFVMVPSPSSSHSRKSSITFFMLFVRKSCSAAPTSSPSGSADFGLNEPLLSPARAGSAPALACAATADGTPISGRRMVAGCTMTCAPSARTALSSSSYSVPYLLSKRSNVIPEVNQCRSATRSFTAARSPAVPSAIGTCIRRGELHAVQWRVLRHGKMPRTRSQQLKPLPIAALRGKDGTKCGRFTTYTTSTLSYLSILSIPPTEHERPRNRSTHLSGPGAVPLAREGRPCAGANLLSGVRHSPTWPAYALEAEHVQ